MKIYTKTGDSGDTGLIGGERVSKTHPRVRAYGSLDELNAWVGWIVSDIDSDQGSGVPLRAIQDQLVQIQKHLFQLGSELACPSGEKCPVPLVDEAEIQTLEAGIDQLESEMETLRSFILPGGCSVGARLHLARTVSRRAERTVIELRATDLVRAGIVKYLNRLSDYLFVAARRANHAEDRSETPWP